MAKKFSETELEALRQGFEALPESEDDPLTWKEFCETVKHMKNGKTPGMDGIPAEVWRNSKVAKKELFKFLQKV